MAKINDYTLKDYLESLQQDKNDNKEDKLNIPQNEQGSD